MIAIDAEHPQFCTGTTGDFVGKSAALMKMQSLLTEVAATPVSVLLLGETGTGKGLAAGTIRNMSPWENGPFIQVNCGAIPENLVESELFGHEKGSFTGAIARKLGKIELAAGGTLFLDEIGDMALDAQVKLLRFLEERTFERVGGSQTLRADVRVIAATNLDLQQMVDRGLFREDLFFRLNVFPIQLPSLRERRDDIGLLAAYFVAPISAHLHKEITHFSPEALIALRSYDWPGNVRELEHVVQRAVIVCSGTVIQLDDITLQLDKGNGTAGARMVTLEVHERQYIREVLDTMDWVVGGVHGAAVVLGIPVSTLRSRMKKLGIARPG